MSKPNYYAAAGELYGALQGSLAYGDLTMRQGTFGGAAKSNAIAYRWDFIHGGKMFSIEEWVPFETLAFTNCVDSFAKDLAEGWNRQRDLIASRS